MAVASRIRPPHARRARLATAGVLTAVATLVVAACGSSGGTGSGATSSSTASSEPTTAAAAPSTAAPTSTAPTSAAPASTAAAPIAGVPARITSAGTIKVGSDITYPPMEFLATDGTTPNGFDIDLFTAVAAKLGVKATYENTKFDSILIGVQSGKYDVGLSSFGITKDRLTSVNLVSYLSVGTQWAVKKGNPKGVQPDAACGKKVAVQTATTQETDLKARSTACTGAGKPAIDVLAEQDGQLPFTDVLTGKADAALSDLVVVTDSLSKTNGQLETAGNSYGKAPFGYAVAKKDTAFAQALATATNALIADGTYATLATKWKVEDAKVATSLVNPAVKG